MGEFTWWIIALVTSSLLIAFGFLIVCVIAMVFAALFRTQTKIMVVYRGFRAELGSTGPAPDPRDESGPAVVEGEVQDPTTSLMEALPPPPTLWRRLLRRLRSGDGGETT